MGLIKEPYATAWRMLGPDDPAVILGLRAVIDS